MNRVIGRSVAALAATAALAGIGVATAGTALADAPTTGRYCSKYDGVAIREKAADSAARDALAKGQQFEVESHPGEHYVYGHKVANGVHGWVLNSSLEDC